MDCGASRIKMIEEDEKKIAVTPLAKELEGVKGEKKRKEIIDELYEWRYKSTNYLQKGVNSKEYAKYAKFVDAVDASISFLEEKTG